MAHDLYHIDDVAWHIFIDSLCVIECLGCKNKNFGQLK